MCVGVCVGVWVCGVWGVGVGVGVGVDAERVCAKRVFAGTG